LRVLDKNLNLTDLGKKMSILPLDPLYSYLLILSDTLEFQCASLMIDLISILQIENLFHVPRGVKTSLFKKMKNFQIGSSDHLTKLNIFHTWINSKSRKILCKENFLNRKGLRRAKLIRDQLRQYSKKVGIKNTSTNCL